MSQSDTGVQAEVAIATKEAASLNRWWIYQRERFPLAAHTPLIAAFSFAAVGYSALARSSSGLPGWRQTFVAFATSMLFFLQLRLADEFKDFQEDSHYRPYRPVPRGLIALRELSFVWAGCLVLQLALAALLSDRLLPLLVMTWAYLFLMTREFFVPIWLKRHAVAYMATHMVITPLIFLYASACDWVLSGNHRPSHGLIWMIAVNYFNGVVVEIGRKIRAPQDEERGVETYSWLWGRRNSVLVWAAAMFATNAFAYEAAREIRYTQFAAWLMLPALLAAVIVALIFLADSKLHRGKWVEAASCIWALLTYLSLGVFPVLLRWYGASQ